MATIGGQPFDGHSADSTSSPPSFPTATSSDDGGTQLQQRHSSRHTIHPKLSLSAKRSTGSMTGGGGGGERTVAPVCQQQNGASTSFQLTVAFSNAENDTPIAFKPDGNRFQTSQRTLKLQSNSKYRVVLKTKPAQDFVSLHIGGSDLELASPNGPQRGELFAIWDTAGIQPSKRGARQDILFLLSGPAKTLNRKLQTKFYARQDSHAGMGSRLNALVWGCETDAMGQIQVTDEKLL